NRASRWPPSELQAAGLFGGTVTACPARVLLSSSVSHRSVQEEAAGNSTRSGGSGRLPRCSSIVLLAGAVGHPFQRASASSHLLRGPNRKILGRLLSSGPEHLKAAVLSKVPGEAERGAHAP